MRLAIDDFGTGYSSLGYLQAAAGRRAQDRQVVRDARWPTTRPTPRSCARPSTSPTTSGCEVVAEGVETEHISAALTALHCDAGQGFYFAGPLPEAEAARWAAEVAFIRAAALEQRTA